MRLRVIPSDPFLAPKNSVAVIANPASYKVNNLIDPQFQAILEVNCSFYLSRSPANGIETQR